MGLGHWLKVGAARLLPAHVMVHGDREAVEIAISFDDGPHPEQTPRLLEALAAADLRATFFLQGNHAVKWPTLVRETHRAGHQIANHGFEHRRASARPAAEFVADVERTQAVLQDIVGVELRRDVRPPYGDITPRTFLQLASRGYRFVFWTIDSEDSFRTDAESLLAHFSGLPVGRGDIVLFHEDYAHTVSAMPAIAAGLRASGFAFRRVDEL